MLINNIQDQIFSNTFYNILENANIKFMKMQPIIVYLNGERNNNKMSLSEFKIKYDAQYSKLVLLFDMFDNDIDILLEMCEINSEWYEVEELAKKCIHYFTLIDDDELYNSFAIGSTQAGQIYLESEYEEE